MEDDRKVAYFVILETIEEVVQALQESASKIDVYTRGLANKDFNSKIEQGHLSQFESDLNQLCRILYKSLIPEDGVDEVIDRLNICKRRLTLLRGRTFLELKQHLETIETIRGFEYMMPLCHLEIVVNSIKPPEDIVAYVEDLVTNRDYIDGEVMHIIRLGLFRSFSESNKELVSKILELVKRHRPKLYQRMAEGK